MDSPNDTDEDGCGSKDQFTCNKNVEANFLEQKCISNSKWCDENDDCSDFIDETFCPPDNQYCTYN